ncbi:MAG TPA: hypothetical protein VNJ04_11830 [Gemmatimonadaceae bacterium]|nr:hypothetical protein [Gemmatimonadaceae bacterium]
MSSMPIAEHYALRAIRARAERFSRFRPPQREPLQVLWPRALVKQMRLGGPVSRSAIPEIERRLALALPPA